MNGTERLIVFVRAPELGRVKTRLAASIGDEAALRVYCTLAEHVLAQARALGSEVTVEVRFTPPEAGDSVRAWLGTDLRLAPQSAGNLGVRMREAFTDAFAVGCQRVAVVGSDLPGLSAELIRRSFDELRHVPAVLGPARDGGYYLLGLTRLPGHFFDAMPWSTDEVARLTLDRLRVAGLDTVLLPTLCDVDEAADLPSDWRIQYGIADPADVG